MKTYISTKPLLTALVLMLPAAFADGAKGGGLALIGPRAVVPGTVAASPMTCPTCADSTATFTMDGSKGRRGERMQLKTDTCMSCKTVLGVVGHGKGKTDTATHSCGEAVKECCEKAG